MPANRAPDDREPAGLTQSDHTRQDALRGIFWMVMATLVSAASGATVRKLSVDMGTMELVFFQTLMVIVVMLPWLMRQSTESITASCRVWPLYLARAGLGLLGITFATYGFGHIPIADVFALQFTTPLFTILLAMLVLRERVGLRGWIAVLVGFSGALIILRPGLIAVSLGSLAALGSAIFAGSANTAIRVLRRTESPYAITAYANILMLPVALVGALFAWTTPQWHHLPWIIALGVFNALNQICLARAIGAADARVVQPFNFLRLPWSVAFGYMLFAELPDAWTWLGAAVIFAGSYEVLRRETGRKKASRDEKAPP